MKIDKTSMMALYTVLAALAMFALMCYAIYMVRKARSWPSVDGRIIASAPENPVLRRGFRYQQSFDVVYEYEVGGKIFNGNRIVFSPFGDGSLLLDSDERQAMHGFFQERFSTGEPVQVFYDPSHPENAVLFPEIKSGQVLVPLFVIAFFGCFWLMGWWLNYRTTWL